MLHKRSNHIRARYAPTSILSILLIIFSSCNAYTQTQLDKASLFQNGFARVVKDNKSWYVDTTGNYAFDKIVPAPDNYTGSNTNSINVVTRQQKLGILKNGQWILKPEYDSIDTQFNVWKIAKDGLTTWCDTSGLLLAPLRFHGISYLDGNHFDVQQKGKWGIYDKQKDSIIIPFLYDEFDYCGGCGLPSDYVLAQKNGKWGVVSFRNEVLVPFEYDHQHMNMRSDEWVMSLQRQSNFTLINMQTGKIFAAPEYTFSGSDLWGDLVCLAKKGKYGLVNKYGRQVVDFMYEDISWFDDMEERKDYYACVKKNGKYGLIDTTGRIVIPILYSGLIWAYNDSTFYMNGLHMKMLFDQHGKHLLPEFYKDIDEIGTEGQTPGLYTITKNGKKGIYNRIAGTLTPIVYDAVSAYEMPGYIITERNKKKGLFNRQGRPILPPVFDQIDAFYDYANLIQVRTGDKAGLYDSSGHLILPVKYDFIFRDYTDTGLIRIKVYTPKGGMEGIATISGKLLLPPLYTDIKEITPQSFLLHKNDHYFLFNSQTGKKDSLPWQEVSLAEEKGLLLVSNGKEVDLYNPVNNQKIAIGFTSISAFQSHAAIAEKNGLLGLLDSAGNPLTPFVYTHISPFEKGIALAQKEKSRYGFIDSTGKEIISLEYDFPDSYNNADFFLSENYIYLFKQAQAPALSDPSPSQNIDFLKGLARKDGKIIIPPIYDLIWQEENGHGFIVKQNGKYGVLNTDGDIIIPPIYENILTENINLYTNKTNFSFPLLCNKDGYWQYLTSTGTVLPYQAKDYTPFEEPYDPPAEDSTKPEDGIKTVN